MSDSLRKTTVCRWWRAAALGAITLIGGSLWAQSTPVVDSAVISGLPARNIGSATMSGRIAAVAAVHDRGQITVYAASASGGVWRSINGGTTFTPIFDKTSAQSIGAITIDPSNPKNLWVGTGESWTRNSVSIGDGVYRSTDGGDNWTNLGLKESEHISKILVDPKDGNTRWHAPWATCGATAATAASSRRPMAARPGATYWPAPMRAPAAACWPAARSEPNTIYASQWDFRRQGWTFRSGGAGSGTFKVHRRRRALDGIDAVQRQRSARPSLMAVLPWPWRPPSRSVCTP